MCTSRVVSAKSMFLSPDILAAAGRYAHRGRWAELYEPGRICCDMALPSLRTLRGVRPVSRASCRWVSVPHFGARVMHAEPQRARGCLRRAKDEQRHQTSAGYFCRDRSVGRARIGRARGPAALTVPSGDRGRAARPPPARSAQHVSRSSSGNTVPADDVRGRGPHACQTGAEGRPLAAYEEGPRRTCAPTSRSRRSTVAGVPEHAALAISSGFDGGARSSHSSALI
ncbi:hypothetical protein OH77DRAFT_410710 [Trametes cingulata]|nr:hypothetical protein OH77DRAFT_410710 [Trametes cingulata]